MQANHRTKLDTFHRVLEFVDSDRPTLANAPPGYAIQVKALRDAVTAITTASQDRGSGSPGYTSTQRRALRVTLRGKLLHLRRVSRVLERSVVGMPQLVNLPKKVASEQALLDAARGAVQDVTPYKDNFVSKGLPENFLDDITGSLQQISDAKAAVAAAQRRRAAARGTLQAAIQAGDDAVTCIDGVVRQACAEDQVNGQSTLTAWNAIVPARSRAALVAVHPTVPAGGGEDTAPASASDGAAAGGGTVVGAATGNSSTTPSAAASAGGASA